MVRIPWSTRDNVLEQKTRDVFQEIGVDKCDRDIQACHRLKDKDRTIVKFTNRIDCLRILRAKIQLKGLDRAAVDLPGGTKTFVNESLCPYWSGIWYNCKKLTLFRMGFFGAPHGWMGDKKAPPPKNLSLISYNDETWHSYTLPKEDPKNV